VDSARFQVSAAVETQSPLGWDATQCMLYSLTDIYPSSRVKRSKSCPETSVNNYQHTLSDNSEEKRPKIYIVLINAILRVSVITLQITGKKNLICNHL